MIDATSTYTANVFVGLRRAFTDHVSKPWMGIKICRRYCDAVGLCVTATPTNFIYSGGQEPGLIIGLINYPRFPAEHETIKAHAMELARLLKDHLGQIRVTVVAGKDTFMIS